MSEKICDCCGEIINEEESEFYELEDGRIICETCFDYHFGKCEMCGKITEQDDLTFWGDIRICSDCLEDECPSFDEEEQEEETREAYEAMLKRYVGRPVTLPDGENYLSYSLEDPDQPVTYDFTVTVENGHIKDISRLTATLLLSESYTSHEDRPYPIDPFDYESIAEDMLDEHVLEEDEEEEEE